MIVIIKYTKVALDKILFQTVVSFFSEVKKKGFQLFSVLKYPCWWSSDYAQAIVSGGRWNKYFYSRNFRQSVVSKCVLYRKIITLLNLKIHDQGPLL